MNRARDHRTNDPSFLEWQAARALEIEQEKAAADAAQAAAEAADPVKAFQKSVNMLAEEIRTAILTGQRLTDDVLQIEHVQGRSVNEDVAVQNVNWWANNQGRAAGFQNYMFSFLYDFVKVNDGSPTAETFQKCFQLLKDYNCLPEAPVAQPVITEVVAEPVLTPSEQFKVNQVNLDTVFAIVDGVEISERYLNSLPSRDELKIRRKLEKGHSGDSNLDEYLERRDVKFAMNQEIERKGAEEQQ